MPQVYVTIAGWDVYPTHFTPRKMRFGGPIRRSLNATGYAKTVATKTKLSLSFPALTAEEMQIIRIIWQRALEGAVTITSSDGEVSGTYLIADQELQFDRLEGDAELWAGVLNFEEQ